MFQGDRGKREEEFRRFIDYSTVAVIITFIVSDVYGETRVDRVTDDGMRGRRRYLLLLRSEDVRRRRRRPTDRLTARVTIRRAREQCDPPGRTRNSSSCETNRAGGRNTRPRGFRATCPAPREGHERRTDSD